MSSVERIIMMPNRALALVTPAKALPEEQSSEDRTPILPVLLIGGIAFFGAITFVGTVAACLALHNTGVMAPW
jgi:hypothetical protein